MIDDENKEEFFENGGQVKVSINDKRRFNDQGEKVSDDDPTQPAEPAKSAREIELENKLKAETERREAEFHGPISLSARARSV